MCLGRRGQEDKKSENFPVKQKAPKGHATLTNAPDAISQYLLRFENFQPAYGIPTVLTQAWTAFSAQRERGSLFAFLATSLHADAGLALLGALATAPTFTASAFAALVALALARFALALQAVFFRPLGLGLGAFSAGGLLGRACAGTAGTAAVAIAVAAVGVTVAVAEAGRLHLSVPLALLRLRFDRRLE
jgi:hypothetical protein